MTQYNLHIYREMRLVYAGIEAESHEAAAEKARDLATGEAASIDDCDGDFEPERTRKAAGAALLLLDMLRHGVISLADGDAEFQGTVYAFDAAAPDWHALVDAIGWETATATITS